MNHNALVAYSFKRSQWFTLGSAPGAGFELRCAQTTHRSESHSHRRSLASTRHRRTVQLGEHRCAARSAHVAAAPPRPRPTNTQHASATVGIPMRSERAEAKTKTSNHRLLAFSFRSSWAGHMEHISNRCDACVLAMFLCGISCMLRMTHRKLLRRTSQGWRGLCV